VIVVAAVAAVGAGHARIRRRVKVADALGSVSHQHGLRAAPTVVEPRLLVRRRHARRHRAGKGSY